MSLQSYTTSQIDLFEAIKKVKSGAGTPEFKNIFSNIQKNIETKTKNSQSFGKYILVCAFVITALFCFTNFAWDSPANISASANLAIVETTKSSDNGTVVTPQVIAELKAESVKNMTLEQKKEALKILIMEADENTLLELLK